jgi:hypothetical protein
MLPSPAWKTFADVQPELRRHLADPAQHVGKRRHRDRPVEAHVVVDLPHRPEGRLPAQPDALGLVLALRLAQLDRVVAARDLEDQAKLLVDLGGAALDLDDQERLAVGIARLGEGLGRADAGAGP